MPGLVGCFGRDRDSRPVLAAMVRCMAHEPDYITGTYADPSSGIHVGWALSHAQIGGSPPVWNSDQSIGLFLCGEIYSIDVGDAPDGRYPGGTPVSHRHLLELYAALGPRFVRHLNGIFSGVIVDLRSRTTYLFNDRFGLARTYLLEDPGGLLFASEAKSLLCVAPRTRRIEDRALGEFLSLGCTLQDRSLFPGITLLPPGSCWSVADDATIQRRRYFQPEEWERQRHLNPEEFYESLKSRFVGLLPRYVAGDGSVGMSLTGGIDSRMIMSWLRVQPGMLPCYSFGGTYRDCADVRIARKIARICRQPHRTIVTGTEFLGQFPVLAERAVYISDGTMDVTGAVELYVNRRAREIAPIRLTGNYGSELIRGNVAFRPRHISSSILRSQVHEATRAAADTYAIERECHPLTFIAFKQVPWHHYARQSVERSQLIMRSPYLDNDLVSLMYCIPPARLGQKEPSLRLCSEGTPQLDAIGTDRGLRYHRRPVLDRLTNAAAELLIKAEYAYDYGMPQWLARIDHALAPLHLERLFLGHQKFYHFRIWYRDALSVFLKQILLDPKTLARTPYDARSLSVMVESHTSGRANFTLDLHRALGIELLHRQLLDRW